MLIPDTAQLWSMRCGAPHGRVPCLLAGSEVGAVRPGAACGHPSARRSMITERSMITWRVMLPSIRSWGRHGLLCWGRRGLCCAAAQNMISGMGMSPTAPVSQVYASQVAAKSADLSGVTALDQCMTEQRYVRDSITRSLIYNQVTGPPPGRRSSWAPLPRLQPSRRLSRVPSVHGRAFAWVQRPAGVQRSVLSAVCGTPGLRVYSSPLGGLACCVHQREMCWVEEGRWHAGRSRVRGGLHARRCPSAGRRWCLSCARPAGRPSCAPACSPTSPSSPPRCRLSRLAPPPTLPSPPGRARRGLHVTETVAVSCACTMCTRVVHPHARRSWRLCVPTLPCLCAVWW